MEWISMKDQRPPKDGRFLIYSLEGVSVGTYLKDYNNGDIFIYPSYQPCNLVTHWMPLPPSPKE